ncbi:MAG: hypothetical protein ACRC6X_05090 [Culicoidibacterales bacterium]
MAKKICLINSFICFLEKNAKIEFKYKNELYLLKKVENRYDFYKGEELELLNSFFNNPYHFFKLVKIDNKSMWELYEDFELVDDVFTCDAQINHAYSDLSIQLFIKLDHAFLRYKSKKYLYFKMDGWSHFNCIYPVSSYSEKKFKDEDFQNAQVIDGEEKTFFGIFNEIIVEKIKEF